MRKIAVVRIRGQVSTDIEVLDTLRMLRLYRKNYCAIVAQNPVSLGMIMKVKDYVAWGEVDDELAARANKSKFIKLGGIGSFALNQKKGGHISSEKISKIISGGLK